MTLQQIDAAIDAILQGGQRVNVNGQSFERANLADLWKIRRELEQREQSAAVSGSIPGGGGIVLADLRGALE